MDYILRLNRSRDCRLGVSWRFRLWRKHSLPVGIADARNWRRKDVAWENQSPDGMEVTIWVPRVGHGVSEFSEAYGARQHGMARHREDVQEEAITGRGIDSIRRRCRGGCTVHPRALQGFDIPGHCRRGGIAGIAA
ncbi:hypothetical protein MRB53_037515 [Persea americana]|nr:hypothetical protein MRB53_037515 [Persea americana]